MQSSVWDFLLTFPLSKPGSFRSLFGHNVNILVEDKGKAEARWNEMEKPKSNINLMWEITSGCVKTPKINLE